MEILNKMFFRILGPILLIAAIGYLFILNSSTSRYITHTKKQTTKNSVYEEATLLATDESTITRDEMKAILLTGPERDIVVYDTDSGVTLTIHAGMNVNNYVKVKYRNAGGSGKNKTVYFGKNRWDADFLDLDDWIQNKYFTSTEITYSTGAIRRIFYKGRND